MKAIYEVVTELETADDAHALASLIEELGYRTRVQLRVPAAPKITPIQNTRLGILVLENMKLGQIYRLSDFEESFEEGHFSIRSISPTVTKLVQAGFVKRGGTYGTFLRVK